MIEKIISDNMLLKFSLKDRPIIKDFIKYLSLFGTFSKSFIYNLIIDIAKLLDTIKIKELTYIKIINYYNQLKSSNMNIMYFLYYLCDKKLLAASPIYRLLLFPQYIFFHKYGLKATNLLYLITLDIKNYKNLTEIPCTNLIESKIILSHLSLQGMQNSEISKLLNDKFNDIKFNDKEKLEQKLNHLKLFNSYTKIILEYPLHSFTSDTLLARINYFTKIKILFEILSLFKQTNYFDDVNLIESISAINKLIRQNINISYNDVLMIVKSKNALMWHKILNNKLCFINCKCQKKLEVLIQMGYSKTHIESSTQYFFNNFDNSLKDPYSELSFTTFLEQIDYFKHIFYPSDVNMIDVLHKLQAFYYYYQVKEPTLFSNDGYSQLLLTTPSIAKHVANNYEIVNYNQLDSIPKCDKWIFSYKNTIKSMPIGITFLNFEIIENQVFRNWVKAFVWYSGQHIETKILYFRVLIKSLNYINGLKTKHILSYYVKKQSEENNITVEEILAYKNHLFSIKISKITIKEYLHILKKFLEYLSDNNIYHCDLSVFKLLTCSDVTPKGNAINISDREIELISKEMANLASINKINELFYIIFYLLVVSELRLTQILNLDIGCIKPTSKNNEFVIISETKTSNKERIEQPISINVKTCIDRVLEITKYFRTDNKQTELNQTLFIIPSSHKCLYKKISHTLFCKYLKQVCNNLNIHPLLPSNLRDYHMSKSEEYIIKNKFSDVQLRILSGHRSSNTTIRHYSRPSILEVLEATNGITIGNIILKGTVAVKVNNDLSQSENTVENGCGYCSATDCPINSSLSCLLCNHFVTTINRKGYFYEQLKLIDSLIKTKSLKHDKEDLLNKKRLFIAYINAIIKLEEELKVEK